MGLNSGLMNQDKGGSRIPNYLPGLIKSGTNREVAMHQNNSESEFLAFVKKFVDRAVYQNGFAANTIVLSGGSLCLTFAQEKVLSPKISEEHWFKESVSVWMKAAILRSIWNDRKHKRPNEYTSEFCLKYLLKPDDSALLTNENAEALCRALQEVLRDLKPPLVEKASLPEWFMVHKFASFLGIKIDSARKLARRNNFKKPADVRHKHMVHRDDAWPFIEKSQNR
jgi:hypothetical protein